MRRPPRRTRWPVTLHLSPPPFFGTDDAPSSYGTLVGIKSVQFIPDNSAIAEVEGTPIRFRLLDSRIIDGYTAAKVER